MAQKETAKVSFYFKMDMVENKTVQMDKKRVGRDMSILIKGMEMPQDCWHCEFFKTTAEGGFSCNRNHKQYDWDLEGRPSDCPLIEIPPHGRLIDADALMKEFEKAENTMAEHGQEYSCSFMSSSQEISTEWYVVEEMVDNSPTVIPSDKEGET